MYDAKFEDYFTTEEKYSYNIMCSIEAYDKFHPKCADSASSDGGRLMPDGSTISVMVSIRHIPEFIENWLQ